MIDYILDGLKIGVHNSNVFPFGENYDTTKFIYDTFEEIFKGVSDFGNPTEYLNKFNLTKGIVLEN